jgi:deazaflavin-dependent oxidoreductase (nitroreductase family)
MLQNVLARFATLKPMTWLTLNLVAPLDRRLLRITSGRLSLTGPATVLLQTTGARSGLTRYTALPAMHFEGEIILIASKGGSHRHPGWYHNLVANPTVKVIHGGSAQAFNARVVTGEERQEIWQWAVQQWAGFKVYEDRAAREMPVVALKSESDS